MLIISDARIFWPYFKPFFGIFISSRLGFGQKVGWGRFCILA
nr:MAG TPA: hypothetical protein [Caudoviricetes sp.]